MKLLEPIKVGNIEFKNRIMFPPLTTGYEEKDGSIGEQSFRFYERLAKGGVGYIVIGDVAPLSTFSPTPKLYSPQQAEGFQRLADACHKYGAKLGIQLFHPDYNVAALNEMFHQGKMQEARAKLHHDMQHFVNEVTAEELDEIIKHMENCAVLAHKAGVDCIEVHGDRLVGSLCSPILNHRTDEYGGSFENRQRFLREIVEEVRKACGKDYPIAIKMTLDSVDDDERPIEERHRYHVPERGYKYPCCKPPVSLPLADHTPTAPFHQSQASWTSIPLPLPCEPTHTPAYHPPCKPKTPVESAESFPRTTVVPSLLPYG